MALGRTTASVSAGNDGTATWAGQVYADIGNIFIDKTVFAATDGATVTFNLNNGSVQSVTLGGNRTLALSNDTDGRSFVIILKQDGTGTRTVTWWANILWPYNITPTLTTTPNKYDVFTFIRIGSSYLGFVVGQNM